MIIRRISTAGVLALSIFVSHRSNAADMLPPRLALPEPTILDPAPASRWSGFYAGGSAGVQLSSHSWTTQSVQNPPVTNVGVYNSSSARTDFGAANFRPAGHIGFNFQFSPSYVAGFEADLGGPAYDTHKVRGIPGTYGAATALTQAGNTDTTRSLLRWDGSIRARFGLLATPSVLIFGTGGIAFASTRYGIKCPGVYPAGSWCVAPRNESQSVTWTGWTIGGGVDAMISESWIARAEYRMSNYGSRHLDFFSNSAGDAVSTKVALRTHTFMVGLSYKFGQKPAPLLGAPVIAKY